jgi:hypothetical protein
MFCRAIIDKSEFVRIAHGTHTAITGCEKPFLCFNVEYDAGFEPHCERLTENGMTQIQVAGKLGANLLPC